MWGYGLFSQIIFQKRSSYLWNHDFITQVNKHGNGNCTIWKCISHYKSEGLQEFQLVPFCISHNYPSIWANSNAPQLHPPKIDVEPESRLEKGTHLRKLKKFVVPRSRMFVQGRFPDTTLNNFGLQSICVCLNERIHPMEVCNLMFASKNLLLPFHVAQWPSIG